MAHPLDRPIWNALNGRHAGLARGDARARCYPSDVSPFAAARDSSPESLAALAALLSPGAKIVLLEAGNIHVPPGTTIERQAQAVQLVAHNLEPAAADGSICSLDDADAPEMLALATLTAPGPFLAATHRFGGFIGIREHGRLAAMAGERLKPDGFAEVSGVCTHPDFRGRGYAGLLSRIVAHRIVTRGETPFLHAYADNAGAIRLYESLGFAIRATMTLTVLRQD